MPYPELRDCVLISFMVFLFEIFLVLSLYFFWHPMCPSYYFNFCRFMPCRSYHTCLIIIATFQVQFIVTTYQPILPRACRRSSSGGGRRTRGPRTSLSLPPPRPPPRPSRRPVWRSCVTPCPSPCGWTGARRSLGVHPSLPWYPVNPIVLYTPFRHIPFPGCGVAETV